MSGCDKAMIHTAVTANAAQEGEQKHHPFKNDPEWGQASLSVTCSPTQLSTP